MEKGTKKILTIVGVVAAVVIGYNFLTKKDEDEAKSGFLGFGRSKKKKYPANTPDFQGEIVPMPASGKCPTGSSPTNVGGIGQPNDYRCRYNVKPKSIALSV